MGAEDWLTLAAISGLVLLVVAWMNRYWFFSRNWPTGAGTAESGNVTVRRYMLFHIIPITVGTAEVAYSYAVNGEYYAGFHKKIIPW